MTLWERVLLGNTLQSWVIALLVTLGVLLALWILVRVVLRRLATFARKTRTDVDDLLAGVAITTKLPLLAILAIYAGSLPLALPEVLTTWLRVVAWIALLIQVAIWADALITFLLTTYQEEHVEEDADRVTTARALSVVARLCLYAIVVLLALDNIPGIEVTALIGSLGVTGIAVALAVQNILGDLFASLSIALDKPFVIGDLIVVGDDRGSVEHIGLKTTRIRSLSGEQLIIGNSDLLGSRIRNYGRMGDRRVVFSIGVAAETPHEKLQQIPTMIREIIESQPQARFDRTHFKAFGDFSLDFEVVYQVVEPDYALYMDIQQAINLAILQRFAEEDIQLPYPTQTVYIAKES